MKPLHLRASPAGVLLALLVVACGDGATTDTTGSANTSATTVVASYDDAFSYCAAVGTLDAYDGRYTGPAITDEIIDGYLEAAGLENSTEPRDQLRETTVWRCMDGAVYACNYGANLPCDAKADTTTTPSLEMDEYCAANSDSEFIPASVTGRETVYSWHCAGETPEVLDVIDEADAAGYLSRVWYRVDAGVSMANPASVYCGEVGGDLVIESRDALGQIGVCYFEDNRQCEEWALYQGDCPVGGLKVTGYATEAGRYCAITGGRYDVTESGEIGDEEGTCTLADGSVVDALDYYEGRSG